MKLHIGNPASGLAVEIELSDDPDDTAAFVVEGCEHLRAASKAWKEWSLENETDDERQLRLEAEEHLELQKKLRAQEASQMRAILDAPVVGKM